MSNTSIGLATKGSKLAIQRLSLKKNTHVINEILDDDLTWISPREEDNYREYRMNSPILLEQLGITQTLKKQYFKDFWPSPQPEWDGIAIGRNQKLYLFEAKSHFSEIVPAKEGNPLNDQLKHGSIMRTAHNLFGIKDTPGNHKTWCFDYYQISNRIAFQQKLKEISLSNDVNYKDVVMVFLNFVNDRTWEAETEMVGSEKEWDNHYDNHIFPLMGINRTQLNSHGICLVNLNLDKLQF